MPFTRLKLNLSEEMVMRKIDAIMVLHKVFPWMNARQAVRISSGYGLGPKTREKNDRLKSVEGLSSQAFKTKMKEVMYG